MRLALLSNVTVEVLAGMLRDEHALWVPPGFGGWIETALVVPPDLKAFNPEAVVLLLDASHGTCETAHVEAAIAALEAALPQTSVLVPDLEDLLQPAPPHYDERLWKIAAMPWSLQGLEAIKSEINRLLGCLRQPRKKVLALDLDNTLWDGVIGEDGLGGIQPRAAFQREIKALRERGVLLVALSRNNASDVEPVWDDPRMVLKKDDFVAMRINWNDKADNLTDIANALNLGTESFVFIDDNPAERAQMAARHPEVTIPDIPLAIRHWTRLYFPRMRMTDEDRRKTAQYQAEARRQELSRGLSFEDYLAQLEIQTEIHPIREEEFARVAQLSQKTNQFNVCTNRYTTDDIARFASDPSRLLVTMHVRDKFGDMGLVAFVQAKMTDATTPATGEIVDWVMSCRAMNRRLEFTLQRWLEEALRERGVGTLLATWRKTGRNEPVRNLFETFGFTRVHETEDEKILKLNFSSSAA